LKEFKPIKDTLEAFLDHQKKDGQLPVKLHSIGSTTRFIHSLFEREQPMEIPLRPKYLSAHGAPSLDGQALLVVAALNYSREANDPEFIRAYWDALVKAISWMERSAKDPNGELLIQGPFADWADSIDRRGRALYTNVLYWQALQEMAEGATLLGLADSAARYTRKAAQVADTIQEVLWRPSLGYFAASDTLDHLTSSGNLLAIEWGLASADQTNSILDALTKADMASPVPTKVAFPPYPMHLVALENRLAGIANYHTDAAWLWIGAWHVIALARANRLDEARATLSRMAGIIVRDQQIHEVYAPTGKPLSNFWYKSESPLTWNAGMIIYAYSVLERLLQSKTDAVLPVNDKKE
jgi:GH15 family glucan-1,4-alpha-glucosidase